MSVASTPSSAIDDVTKPAMVAAQFQPDSVVSDAARMKRCLYVAGGAIALATVWAFWPLDRSAPEIALSGSIDRTKEVSPLNAKVFEAPVWTLAALPQPPAPPPAPPPAITEQLLAISMDEAAPSAMFYRPKEDRILTLHVGDTIGGRTIKAIAVDRVTLVWKSASKLEVVETLYTYPRDARGTGGTP